MLRIYLLGPFRVERDDQPIAPQAWARPRDRALLKVLALERGHLLAQDRLIELLWPGLPPSVAANSLHVAVSRVRKLLAPSPPDGAPRLIRREGPGYILLADPGTWTDFDAYKDLLTQAREWRRRAAWALALSAYQAADALYRGELCEEDVYDAWALQPREQARSLSLVALEDMAECFLQLGQAGGAVEACERGLARSPGREGLYAWLMRAHAGAGRVAEALHAYERCRLALVEDLGVEPGEEVRSLYEQVLKGIPLPLPDRDVPPCRPHAAVMVGQLHLPCVGRAAELGRLVAALDAVQNGKGGLMLVHGEPGIGKTRLLEELEQIARRRGLRVLSARCYELEQDIPYAPLVEALSTFLQHLSDPGEVRQVLGQWGPQLATLLPVLHDLVPDLPPHLPLRGDAERPALLAGLAKLLFGLGQRVPLLLVLDDLQWSDSATVQVLHYLARRLVSARVLVVGAYSTGEVAPEHSLRHLLDALGHGAAPPELIELGCLTPEHVAVLLPGFSAMPRHAQALAQSLHQETDGHPLFLVETLRTLLETRVLVLDPHGNLEESEERSRLLDAAGPGMGRLPLPPSLHDAIVWRVRRLDERQRKLLNAAAVAGHGFRPALLAYMTNTRVDAVLDGLEALEQRQLVRPAADGAGFDFRHDLIRAVVYAGIGAERRRNLHAALAEALEAAAGGRPEMLREVAGDLAHHWREAERWEAAYDYALLAGDRARQTFAPREALVHYGRAAELSRQSLPMLAASKRLALLERLGQARAELGEPDAAIPHFEALLAAAQAAGERALEGRALLALADAHFWRHDFALAKSISAAALQLSEGSDDLGLRAGTRISAANVAMAQGRLDDAERHCEAVLELAGTPAISRPLVAAARLNALGWLGLLRELQGDHARSLPALEASLRLGHELHNPFLTGRARFALGMSLGNRGEYEAALATLGDALRLAEEAGDRYFMPRLPNTIGWVYAELGDLAQAGEWNRRSIAAARETGWLEAEANARVNMGGDALGLGDLATARAEFEQAAALIERDAWFTWRYRIRLLLGWGELALAQAAPVRALDLVRQALALAEPTRSRKHAGRAWLLHGRALLAAGAPPRDAIAAIDQARKLALAAGHPPLRWTCAAELARLHARLHDDAAATACQDEAVTTIQGVAASIQDPSLRRLLLARPAVQAILSGA